MAVITNYASLQSTIADYLQRSDLLSYIPNFIQNCENKLYRTLNLRNEETALDVSISGGVAAVPTDFKALKFAYVDSSPIYHLRWVPINELYNDFPIRSGGEPPKVISREADNFVFGPYPADGTLRGIYYAKPQSIRATGTSWYATNAPEVLLYGSLLEAAPFIRDDERIIVWRSMYAEAVDTLKQEQMNAEYSKGSLAARAS